MRRASWIVSLIAIAVAPVIGLVATGVSANAAPTSGPLSVTTTGHDTGNCQSAPCLTIGYALSQAASGATINVGPGTFPEQLVITKPVTIDGSGPATTVIEPTTVPIVDTDDVLGYGVKQFATVDVKGTTGVNLNGFGVNGLAATPSFDTDGLGCDQSPLGIYFHDASGSVGNVAVTNIDLPVDLFGCQGGQGIYVVADPGKTSTVGIDAVAVTNYDKNGITCDDVGTSCSIFNSIVEGDGPITGIAQNGIQAIWSTANIQNDTILDNSYSGANGPASASGILVLDAQPVTINNNTIANNDVNIFAGEDGGLSATPYPEPIASPAPGTWTITDNTISNATNNGPYPFGDGYGDDIQLVSTSNPVNVVGNIINGAAEFGVGLYNVSNASVWENAISHAGDGIYVGGPGYISSNSSHDAITADAVTSDSRVGILADTTSNNNAFVLDLVAENGHPDIINNGTNNTFILAGSTLAPVVDIYAAVVLTLAHLLPLR